MEQKESDMSLLVQNIVAAQRAEDAENVTDAATAAEDEDDVAADEDDVAAEDAAEVAEEATGEDAADAADSADAVDNAEDAAGIVDYVDSSDVTSSSPFPRAASSSSSVAPVPRASSPSVTPVLRATIASLSPITDGDDSSLSSPDAVSSSYVPTTSRKRKRKRSHDAPLVLKRSTREKGPRTVVPLIQAGDEWRFECRQANKADVLFELQSHKEMFYYCMRTWRNKIIGKDETSNVQDGYVYYYIHPFGRLGRLKRRATITHIRSSTVGVDYFLHKDMEKLLGIYNNLSSLTHPGSGSQVTSWAEYDTLCGGRDRAREYYYHRFPEQPQVGALDE